VTAPKPDPALAWPLPYESVALIAEFEGLRLVAYQCSAGVWTIGWGETDGVRPGDRCTKEQADRWLLEDLEERVRAVRDACTLPATDAELGAMVSLAYNIGMGWDPSKPKPKGAKDGFRQSTVLRQHNAGNHAAAARAFGLWNQITNPTTGQKEDDKGLTARRAREASIYLSGAAQSAPMPQAVEPESKMTDSKIVKTSTAATGAGVIAIVTQIGDHVSALKPVAAGAREVLVDTLGIPVNWLLPIAVIVTGVLVVRWRLQQRREGWA